MLTGIMSVVAPPRREAAIEDALQRDFDATDTLMMRVVLAHWALAASVMGLAQGFYLAGFAGGAVITGIAWLGYRHLRGTVYSRMLMGVCLMLFSALYIQQSLGRIEYHFHVFIALALLIRYKDLRPLLAAVVTIATHHLVFSLCQESGLSLFGAPLMVFNYGTGLDIVLLHAAFVVFEAVFIGHIILQVTEQFCADVREAHENLEVLDALRRVISTGDLSLRMDCENEKGRVVNELLDLMNANVAVRIALDKANASVVIVDRALDILECNESAEELFRDAAADFATVGVTIDAGGLIGQPVTALLPDETASRLRDLADTHETEFEVGRRTFHVVINPVVNDNGERLGTIVEYEDRTQEIVIEREVHDMVRAASAGDLSRRISLEQTSGFFATLGEAVNRLVEVADNVITECSGVLSALAAGDLTRSVETRYDGQFGALTTDLNSTIARLTGTVQEIKGMAAQVNDDAENLVAGNLNLSDRFKQQAASLEETAANMEQMTGAVQTNAQHAARADELTTAAREQAEHGGIVINDAVAAMSAITEASKRIAEITGVIDEIAFQTNLLALNASVEAARAGEQGRGFAVVASEVRNLAGRSATAAKEISGLISDSVAKVREGERMVNESGETLAEIVRSVQQASAIVGEIARANQEQSDGIQIVSKAVTEMDDMTQQNAALVDAAAEASQSMGRQSRALMGLVRFFSTERASANDASNAA